MNGNKAHGVRFASGAWLKGYRRKGLVAYPRETRDAREARPFDSKDDADNHIQWAGWGKDEATAEPLPEERR